MLLNPIFTENKLASDQYISDLKIIEERIPTSKNFTLFSQTNTGKTQACFEAIKNTNSQFVFAVDCKLLAEQLADKYCIPVYYSGKPKPTGNCITIYNHVGLFKNKESVLFVDEFHSIVKDYGYKRDVIDAMLRSFSGYKQVIGLTGTPILDMDGFESVRVFKPRSERIINHINTSDFKQQLIYNIIKNPNKVHYVSLFDKKSDYASIVAYLIENGFNETDIATINSETKDSPEFMELIKEEKINNKKVIITTYTQGFNIKGKDYVIHIIPKADAAHSIEDVEQVVNRFRNEVPEIYFYCSYQFGHEISFNTEKEFNDLLKKAQEKIRWGQKNLNFSFGKLDETQNRVMNNLLDSEFENLVNIDLKPNIIQIAHLLHRKRNEALYTDYEFMKYALGKHGYKLQDYYCSPLGVVKGDEAVQSLVETIMEFKEAKYKERVDAVLYQMQYLRPVDEVSKKFNLLYESGVPPKEACELLKKIMFNKRKWNKVLDQISVLKPKTGYQAYLVEDIYSSFEIGNTYTAEAIQEKFNGIYKKNDLGKLATKTKLTQLLNNYFITKRVRTSLDKGRRPNAIKLLDKLSEIKV